MAIDFSSTAWRFLVETWGVTTELAPSLLLGLLLAGLLHVYLPRGLIRRRLSARGPRSVLEAVLIGVPMPLCSCGVLPAAIGMRKEGASRGAATGFLISTPQTGVDSIAVSASFLGWPFAIFKVAAAFVTGMLGGLLVDATEPRAEREDPAAAVSAPVDDEPRRFPDVFRFAILEILATIDVWIVFGVAVSALIGMLVPPGYLAGIAWLQGIVGMIAVLAVAMPLYVCTTGSVPIAASLIAAGMPAGSALVFLMAGPATNAATIVPILRTFGGRVLAIYLGVVAVMSVLFGLVFDSVIAVGHPAVHAAHRHGIDWLGTGAAAVLLVLLVYLFARRASRRLGGRRAAVAAAAPGRVLLDVKGMNCAHCVATVKNALEGVPNVASASPDLGTGEVVVEARGGLSNADLVAAVERAGFQAAVKTGKT